MTLADLLRHVIGRRIRDVAAETWDNDFSVLGPGDMPGVAITLDDGTVIDTEGAPVHVRLGHPEGTK